MPRDGFLAQHTAALLPLQPIAVKRGRWVRRMHAGGDQCGRRRQAGKSWYAWCGKAQKTGKQVDRSPGSILFAFFGILAAIFLFLRSERKKAAVGRRCVHMAAYTH